MGNVVELKKDKIFGLKAACELLPVVKKITEEAALSVEQLRERLEDTDSEDPQRKTLEQDIASIVDRWSHKMTRLGCEPKGMWLVDFDNGEGFYCWRYPETELGHYHTYDGGFASRTPIL